MEQILAGSADDLALAEKSSRIASLQAQIGTLRKRANVSGTALQTRLQKDIAACEWLATPAQDSSASRARAKGTQCRSVPAGV